MKCLSIESLRKEFPKPNSYIQDSIKLSEGANQSYDIFLSHKYLDKLDVLRIKEKLTSYGLTVFIDWELEQFGDRDKINKKIAKKIIEVMEKCNVLIYSTTKNYNSSVWMPWKLGLFHGIKGIDRVAIMPITTRSDEKYPGTEYLELYYYIDEAKTEGTDRKHLWVNESDDEYVKLNSWVRDNRQPRKC